MKKFLSNHKDDIIGTTSGFDRLVFRGTLRRLSYKEGMRAYLWAIKVLFKDFATHVLRVTNEIKKSTEEYTQRESRPLIYLPSSNTNKAKEAQVIASATNIKEGLICVFKCVEPCYSYDIYRNKQSKLLELVLRQRKCLFFYHYYIHPVFGFMNCRIQSWFPFPIQVCVNGKEWLSKQMDKAGIPYLKKENCFTWIGDIAKAKSLIENQLKSSWPILLNDIAQRLNPIHDKIFQNYPIDYYWSVHQSEWATDIMFKSSEILDKLYSPLIRFAMVNFSSSDIMRFLGKETKLNGDVPLSFKGEIISDVRKRPEGVRIKHIKKQNSIKMYNKQGSVLRVETTINDPREFNVYRPKTGCEENTSQWLRMRKGVADLHRRAKVSHSANERYLDAIGTAQNTRPLKDLSSKLCQPTIWNNKIIRAIRPLSLEDSTLLDAVSEGKFLLNGFRNRDLRDTLYKSTEIDNHIKKTKKSSAVTRKIRILRGHGLVKKIPKTHRYFLTQKGREAISAIQAARFADINSLIKLAA